jgi:cytochrome c-type biogenesis protein
MSLFAGTRAGFIGLAGALATTLGTAFLGFQRAGYLLLGGVYAGLGLLFVAGMAGRLMVAVGPGLRRIGAARGSALLGILLGVNIPACAAPLIFALLGTSAAAGAAGGTALSGFASLALFGLALSLPLILAVLFAPGRRAIDRFARYSTQAPIWTGLILIALGFWSIGFALFATIKP